MLQRVVLFRNRLGAVQRFRNGRFSIEIKFSLRGANRIEQNRLIMRNRIAFTQNGLRCIRLPSEPRWTLDPKASEWQTAR